MAEAHVSKSMSYVTVGLSGDAQYMVKEYKNFVCYTGPLYYRKGRWEEKQNGQCYWCQPQTSSTVSSRSLVKVLAKYGITRDKTYNGKFAPILANNRHVWRGYIDGDGCLTYNVSSQRLRWRISVAGTKALLEQLNDFAGNTLGIPRKSVRPITRTKSCYEIQFHGAEASLLIKLLYGDCTIALRNNLAKAEEMFEPHRPRLYR